jgi:nitrogen regulatory protein P-II 1
VHRSWGFFRGPLKDVGGVVKVEAVVIRERVETVIDAVEEQTGHVGVTVVEAIGHGRQRGVTHEYRGRVFESRFLPKALLVFIVGDDRAAGVVDAIVDAARSGHESGDGIVWTTAVGSVRHNRTGKPLEDVEVAA